MATAEDGWTEYCRIAIVEDTTSTSTLDFEGMTEDISAMDWGEKDIEGIATLKGGRIIKRTPMTDESITLKVYPISANLADNEGLIQQFHPQDNDAIQALEANDTSVPIAVKNSHGRNKYKVYMLWSTSLPADAVTQPADTGQAAYRISIRNAYMASFKPSFDDKIMSAEATFKWAPFAKDGTYNKIEESTDGSVRLPAIDF